MFQCKDFTIDHATEMKQIEKFCVFYTNIKRYLYCPTLINARLWAPAETQASNQHTQVF